MERNNSFKGGVLELVFASELSSLQMRLYANATSFILSLLELRMRCMMQTPTINAVKLDLWFTSLIYHLIYGIYGRAEAFKEFLLARWLDLSNTTAYAYLAIERKLD